MMTEKNVAIYKEYVYDFAVDGGATGDLVLRAANGLHADLEDGLLVKDAIVVNEAALSGSAALTLGTKTDPDGFLVDFKAKVASVNTVVRAGEVDGALLWDSTADAKKAHRIDATLADDAQVVMNIGTAVLTAGKLRVILECYKPNSAVGY